MSVFESADDELIARLQAARQNPISLALPKSDEYVINSRGQRLNVRTYTGDSSSGWKARGVVVYIHGYAAHISRPPQPLLAQAFNRRGFAYAGVDFHGHGYSEGDRALVLSCDDLIDDVMSFMLLLYSRGPAGSRTANGGEAAISVSGKLNFYAPPNIPFWLMGSSMGGGCSVLVGNLLSGRGAAGSGAPRSAELIHSDGSSQEPSSTASRGLRGDTASSEGGARGCYDDAGTHEADEDSGELFWNALGVAACAAPFASTAQAARTRRRISLGAGDAVLRGCFSGLVLVSPAINIKRPPAAVVAALNYLVVPFFGNSPVPSLIESGLSKDHLAWRHDEYINYINADYASGLSYAGKIKFRTASSILAMGDRVMRELPTVACPFIVLHDPDDEIVQDQGSQDLLSQSATPQGQKRYVQVPRGLHDIIANEMQTLLDEALFFIESTLRWRHDEGRL